MFENTYEQQFRIAANTGIVSRPGQKPDFATGTPYDQLTPWQRQTRSELTYRMVNGEATPQKIAKIIRAGGSITAWHTGGKDCQQPFEIRNGDAQQHVCWSKQHRCSANFTLAQHLGADFDNLESETELFENELVQQHGSIIYHTPSSYYQGNGPKMRVIFLLDTPITDGPLYKDLILAMQWKFEDKPDPSCRDHCRLFYGNLGCEPIVTGQILPLATAMRWLSEYKANRPVKPTNVTRLIPPGTALTPTEQKRTKAFGDAVLRRAEEKVRSAMPGNRHYELKRQGYNVFCYVHGGVIREMDARQALDDAYRSHVANPLDLKDLLEWCYENTRDNAQGLPADTVSEQTRIRQRREWFKAKGQRHAS
jgi:hypothetical protein